MPTALPRRAALATALALAPGRGAWAQAAPLRVLATGAVEHALRDLAAGFATATGRPVLVSIGNAGRVAARLEAGEPADLVINSAFQITALTLAGRLRPGTAVELGRMRIGLGVRQGAPSPAIPDAPALRQVLLDAPSFSYSDPATGATTGLHLQRMMQEMGIWETMQPRSLAFAQGLDAVRAVAEGRAALVLTQISEIVAVPGVTLAGPLPDAVQLVTPYVGAITKAAAEPDGAAALLRELTSPAGRSRFAAAGFI